MVKFLQNNRLIDQKSIDELCGGCGSAGLQAENLRGMATGPWHRCPSLVRQFGLVGQVYFYGGLVVTVHLIKALPAEPWRIGRLLLQYWQQQIVKASVNQSIFGSVFLLKNTAKYVTQLIVTKVLTSNLPLFLLFPTILFLLRFGGEFGVLWTGPCFLLSAEICPYIVDCSLFSASVQFGATFIVYYCNISKLLCDAHTPMTCQLTQWIVDR